MSDAYNAAFAPPAQPVNPPVGPGESYAQTLGQPATAPPAEEFGPVLNSVASAYPALAPHLANTVVQRCEPSGPNDDRQLEFYGPNESDNPNPGRITLQLFDPKLKGDSLREAVALDMLHHMGGTDAAGAPNDPQYFALKQQLVDQVKAANRPMDRQAYEQEKAKYQGYNPTYDDWMQDNRSDAYIRAMVNPSMNPEWTRPGIITPEMQKTGDQIVRYLKAKPQGASR